MAYDDFTLSEWLSDRLKLPEPGPSGLPERSTAEELSTHLDSDRQDMAEGTGHSDRIQVRDPDPTVTAGQGTSEDSETLEHGLDYHNLPVEHVQRCPEREASMCAAPQVSGERIPEISQQSSMMNQNSEPSGETSPADGDTCKRKDTSISNADSVDEISLQSTLRENKITWSISQASNEQNSSKDSSGSDNSFRKAKKPTRKQSFWGKIQDIFIKNKPMKQYTEEDRVVPITKLSPTLRKKWHSESESLNRLSHFGYQDNTNKPVDTYKPDQPQYNFAQKRHSSPNIEHKPIVASIHVSAGIRPQIPKNPADEIVSSFLENIPGSKKSINTGTRRRRKSTCSFSPKNPIVVDNSQLKSLIAVDNSLELHSQNNDSVFTKDTYPERPASLHPLKHPDISQTSAPPLATSTPTKDANDTMETVLKEVSTVDSPKVSFKKSGTTSTRRLRFNVSSDSPAEESADDAQAPDWKPKKTMWSPQVHKKPSGPPRTVQATLPKDYDDSQDDMLKKFPKRSRSKSVGTIMIPPSILADFERGNSSRSSFQDNKQNRPPKPVIPRDREKKTLFSRLFKSRSSSVVGADFSGAGRHEDESSGGEGIKVGEKINKPKRRQSIISKSKPHKQGPAIPEKPEDSSSNRQGFQASQAEVDGNMSEELETETPIGCSNRSIQGKNVKHDTPRLSVCTFEFDTQELIMFKRKQSVLNDALVSFHEEQLRSERTDLMGLSTMRSRSVVPSDDLPITISPQIRDAASSAMFGRKSHGDVKKSASKVLDHKKDTVTRLKHLRVVLETYDVDDAKNFFDQHYSYIYYIFHDHFTTVEADLKQRANKQHREELDFVLYVLEKILTLLPELIHKRWQYHSIGRIMKKLLHPGNSIKVQREGMRLFLIWYQILMDNATEECHSTYKCLVPQLGSAEGLGVDIFTGRPVTNSKILCMEICPILQPLSGEEPHDSLTRTLLKFLLKYMVDEVKKVQWASLEMHTFSFNFLFNKFKEFYLRNIFPDFRENSIYSPSTELPGKRLWHPATEANRPPMVAACQEAVVEWFTRTLTVKKQKPPNNLPDPQDKPPEDDVDRTLEADRHGDTLPGSNASTLSMGSSATEHDSTGSDIGFDEHSPGEHDIVCQVLYSTRENIDIMHEVFRQAFQFPFHEGSTDAIKRVIHVYQDWFKIVDDKERPVFMQEVANTTDSSPGLPRSESTPVIQNGSDSFNMYSASQPHLPNAVSMGSHLSKSLVPDSVTNVCAGLQRVIQTFITNAANVFLMDIIPVPGREPEHGVQLTAQVAICKKVINAYRYIIQHHFLEQKTWEQMLFVLLKMTSGVLSVTPPKHRENSLGGKLAHAMLQTLIVTWIKANIHVHINAKLWDDFYKVLSSLTGWAELVQEWAKHMETLTRVLARHVYDLDLNDLPLDRLSEQKAKRQRGRRPNSKDDPRKRTFSRGLSRNDPIEILRAQMRNRELDPASRTSGHHLGVSESTPIIRSLPPGLSRDDSHPCLHRHRSRSGEASPLSMSQTHLHGDGLPSPGPMLRSNSDSSLMVDMEKSGSSDLLLDNSRHSLTEDVLTQIGMYYSAPEDVDVSEPEDEIFDKIISVVEPKVVSELARVEVCPERPIISVVEAPVTHRTIMDSVQTIHQRAQPADVDSRTGASSRDSAIAREKCKNKNGGKPSLSHEYNDRTSVTSTIPDNTSVTSGDSSVPYQIIDTDSNSLNFEKASLRSDTEVLLRLGGPSSQSSLASTQPHSSNHDCYNPSADISGGALGDNEDDDVVDSVVAMRGRRVKDSPTPDRESLHIEEVNAICPKSCDPRQAAVVHEEDEKSVIMGGTLPGWTPVSAVVLWRRMLGCLGDINKITDPDIHAQVYEYLCDLGDLMLKMRDNQSVTRDNQASPQPPEFLPPISLFSGWLYEALNLPKEYKRGTLLAYRLLCTGLVRRHDVELSMEQLARFYLILHHGLVSQDQDIINVLVKHCGAKFFSLPLRGATALLLDFVQAAELVSTSSDLKEAPRAEAISLLGSLVCYPGHVRPIPTLQPHSHDLTVLQCSDLKDHVISILLRSGKKEPAGLARCIALSSLGVYIYQELSHSTNHSKLKEAFYVLLATLRVSDTSVAQVATDTLTMLCDHISTLLISHPQLPQKIIQEIAKAIYILLLSLDNSSPEKSKRLLVSTMFCLLEWCMRVPLSILLEKSQSSSCLIHLVFKVLHIVLCGPQGLSSQQHRNLRNEFCTPEDDLNEPSRDSPVSRGVGPSKSVLEFLPDYTSRAQRGLPPSLTVESSYGGAVNSSLQLAARTVLSHLVNHLGHFPMGSGAGQLNTVVQEHHDLLGLNMEELTSDIFHAPNVQFFVLNNTTLITLVEIPAQTDMPGGGVTAGLTTARTQTRAIIRDPAGKYCWDSSVLYGPPRCRAGSYPAAPQIVVHPPEDLDLVGQSSLEAVTLNSFGSNLSFEGATEILPSFEGDVNGQDSLAQMLQYIGQTSPECLLHPGEALNSLFHRPEEVSSGTEDDIKDCLLQQGLDELNYFDQHQYDSSMVAQPLLPMDNIDQMSPFHLCRLFLNQLGFLQWEKRANFDLLRKTDKLLRDLKHLDSQRCRETHKIAVIYVAPGQEDKQSILGNNGGSKAYEDFIAGLGWEVDLQTHTGFMGGLQSNKSTGATAPYYATSTLEVVYHVATRMPSDEEEDKHRKLRHLGNDEVQIVWSEHTRDYRRGIIPTEFGDVLIIVYPLDNGLYRIQINRKPEVPYIGPLFDGAIVGARVLPGLVRATAFNAGRVLRLQKPYYQSFYEERARYVEDIVRNHKEATMFEEFAASVFAPVQPHGDPLGSQVSLSEPLSLQTSQFYSSLGSDTDSINSRGSNDKVSPHASKVKGEGSAFQRRLSFGKAKKSVTKQMQLQQVQGQGPGPHVPPDSPTTVLAKGKK